MYKDLGLNPYLYQDLKHIYHLYKSAVLKYECNNMEKSTQPGHSTKICFTEEEKIIII